jgi:hypothetical protein
MRDHATSCLTRIHGVLRPSASIRPHSICRPEGHASGIEETAP